MEHAKGTLEVNLVPQQDRPVALLGRTTIDKKFEGDLVATSEGQMVSGGDPKTGSAGYVAMERVEGTLKGKRGSFILQHSGTMNRGASSLSVTVVPDSGTGELTGLTGTLAIVITVETFLRVRVRPETITGPRA